MHFDNVKIDSGIMAKLLGYFGLKFTYSVVNQLCNNAIRSISFFGSKKVSLINI